MLLNPEELKSQPAGFGLHGSPNQLSILRTYKQSIGRRIALRMPLTEQIDELEERLKQDLTSIWFMMLFTPFYLSTMA